MEVNSTWRLIDTGPLDAPSNMAVDEALLLNFEPENSQPVLRLYGWEPPAFSLGKFQNAVDVLDLQSCAAAGIPVVRRVTGGGVIYHANELTYSIVCGQQHIPQARTVKESFRALSAFLLLTYRRLGLDAAFAVDRLAGKERLGERTPLCFAGREEYDIVVNGRKLGGNAQRRGKEIIFQHGSIPLHDSLADAAGYVRDFPPSLPDSVASLARLGVMVNCEMIKQFLVESFAETLNTVLIPDAFSDREERAIQELKVNKYDCQQWNLEGKYPI